MAVYRFPVLAWKDRAGGYTAALVENEKVCGYGSTLPEATLQVKAYLQWLYREEPWREGSAFGTPRLSRFKVRVRPEYQVDGKVFPYDRSLSLKVACVQCEHVSGLRAGSLPRLGIQFFYGTTGSLRDLVRHYVQEHFAHLAPREIGRYLPPEEFILEEVLVKTQAPARAGQVRPETSGLSAVADSIATRTFRRAYHRAHGRDKEVAELVRRSSDDGANVLLVGKRGCGKSTVLVEAVRVLEQGRGSPRHWMTRAARVVSGMKYLGQWEQRCEQVVSELDDLGGVLCVENALELIQTGGAGPRNSVASFLVPYLEQGELQMVAEATPEELVACRRLLPGFVDLFGILRVEDLVGAAAVDVLDKVAGSAVQRHRIEFGQGVTEEIYRLHRRFLPYHGFPGKAVAFLDQLLDLHRTEGRISRQAVTEHFSAQTGLPGRFLRDEEPLAYSEVLDAFQSRVIGQERACRAVADLVTTFKAGLNDPERPLGVHLFCGPTGVGKTETAKAVADFFFGEGEDRERLVRLDMSEYAGVGAAERLLGDENRPGELVRRVRRQPFVVVLLDEIEKAHPDVYDVLLSVFDEGRLTDAYGRTTTFRSTVVIMTSNLGAESLRPVGLTQRSSPSYESEAMGYFRPEFFNRIDSVVSFEPLGPEPIHEIAVKELEGLSLREGLVRRGLRLQWSPQAAARLAELGYDARYGARPLKRVLEDQVVVPLARYLVASPGRSQEVIHLEVDEEGRFVLI